MAERKQVSKKIRFEFFKRDNFTCQYCGRKAPQVSNLDDIWELIEYLHERRADD